MRIEESGVKLTELLARKGFLVTGEVGPPHGADPTEALERARMMAPVVDAINATDGQGANLRMGSLALCRLLAEEGIEPVLQLTCRDRNRIALQAELLSAAALGIHNVLIVTGDHVALGDHPQAKAVFDLDSVQLLHVARGLNEGRSLAGRELTCAPDLCLGAVVAPEADNMDLQILKMRKKVDAGAQFFQTQAVFSPPIFERFMEQVVDLGVPVLAGIIPVRSATAARFLNARVPGVNVPPWVMQRLNEAAQEDRTRVGAEIAAQIMAAIAPMCQGVHLMPHGMEALVPEIIAAAGLARPRQSTRSSAASSKSE